MTSSFSRQNATNRSSSAANTAYLAGTLGETTRTMVVPTFGGEPSGFRWPDDSRLVPPCCCKCVLDWPNLRNLVWFRVMDGPNIALVCHSRNLFGRPLRVAGPEFQT